MEYLLAYAAVQDGDTDTSFEDRLATVLSHAWEELPRPRDNLVEGLANTVRADQSLLVVEIGAAALAL